MHRLTDMQQGPRGKGQAGNSMNTGHGTYAMPQMKASDADRDAVLADLSKHFEAGRLTSPELDERTGRALTARTLDELQDLMNDLPDAQPVVPAAAAMSPRHVYPALAPVIVALAAVAIVSIVAGAVHGNPAWSVWWIIPAALIARRITCRRAPPGSGADPDPGPRAARLGDIGYNCQVASVPTLIVVSGPVAAGKTTLAHQLARAVGCPAICRDEIKEGMALARPGFAPAPGDELTARTLPVFFSMLELLLRAGVTTVADAAFQDHVWRPRLESLRGLACLRIVHCVVASDIAFRRARQRSESNPVRQVHVDPGPERDLADFVRRRDAFNRVSVPAPWIEVDTSDGYRPRLEDIVSFVCAAC